MGTQMLGQESDSGLGGGKPDGGMIRGRDGGGEEEEKKGRESRAERMDGQRGGEGAYTEGDNTLETGIRR